MRVFMAKGASRGEMLLFFITSQLQMGSFSYRLLRLQEKIARKAILAPLRHGCRIGAIPSPLQVTRGSLLEKPPFAVKL